jgi:hypothetical protein
MWDKLTNNSLGTHCKVETSDNRIFKIKKYSVNVAEVTFH